MRRFVVAKRHQPHARLLAARHVRLWLKAVYARQNAGLADAVTLDLGQLEPLLLVPGDQRLVVARDERGPNALRRKVAVPERLGLVALDVRGVGARVVVVPDYGAGVLEARDARCRVL